MLTHIYKITSRAVLYLSLISSIPKQSSVQMISVQKVVRGCFNACIAVLVGCGGGGGGSGSGGLDAEFFTTYDTVLRLDSNSCRNLRLPVELEGSDRLIEHPNELISIISSTTGTGELFGAYNAESGEVQVETAVDLGNGCTRSVTYSYNDIHKEPVAGDPTVNIIFDNFISCPNDNFQCEYHYFGGGQRI